MEVYFVISKFNIYPVWTGPISKTVDFEKAGMMDGTTTNLFRTQYQQPENKLTYSFICLIEHLSQGALERFFPALGFRIDCVDTHSVSLLYGGGESNPDGCLTIGLASRDEFRIYLESKTVRRQLDLDQIRRHLSWLTSPKDILLVLTANRGDGALIGQLDEGKIRFTTWHHLIGFCRKYSIETKKF